MIVGDATAWADAFPDHLLPEIMEVVCLVWNALRKPLPNDHETKTSRRMCASLRQSPALRALPLRVDVETVLIDDTGETEIGRLDLRFTSASYHPEAYFSFECKRLCVKDGAKLRVLATEYVNDGMKRYVTGQYAPARRHGGMIGYVHTGTRTKAMAKVDKVLAVQASALGMKSPAQLRVSPLCPANDAARMTEHTRANGAITIHHLFLSCS
jgi:hypothetical protein